MDAEEIAPELELHMRHFLVNIEKISFSFFHSLRQLLPRVVSGWTAQSAHPSLPDSAQGSPGPLQGATLSSKPQVCCLLLYFPPRLVLLHALRGYNCYQSLPRIAPAALHSKWAAPAISHTVWFLTATPKSRRDQCWRAHIPALQASAVNSVAQFNIKNITYIEQLISKSITQNSSLIIHN